MIWGSNLSLPFFSIGQWLFRAFPKDAWDWRKGREKHYKREEAKKAEENNAKTLTF